MKRVVNHISRHLNLNTLGIGLLVYFVKSGVGRIERNIDMIPDVVAKVNQIEIRVDNLEKSKEDHAKELQKLWDRSLRYP